MSKKEELRASATRLIKIKEVLTETAMSKGTLYNMVRAGEFCQPVKTGKRSVRFVEAEVQAWIHMRMAKRNDGAGAK